MASGRTLSGVGFIVTNMARHAENVIAFYNKRGTCEQWIKEGKGAIKWTRLSCRSFAANAVRLQLHALAHNLGNFLRTLAGAYHSKDEHAGIVGCLLPSSPGLEENTMSPETKTLYDRLGGYVDHGGGK
jgi:hypothetical protein